MLKDLLEYILNIQNPEIIEVFGRKYSTKGLKEVFSPVADTRRVSTLTGLVDYIKANVDGLNTSKLIVHVVDHSRVDLISALSGDFRQREMTVSTQADLLQMQFNSWVDAERFNIFMQACFLPTADRDAILKVVGNIRESTVRDARVGNAKVPNPVVLKPFRTFVEVEQPESQFVFRMRTGPECMLVEADGGAWRNVARQNIKKFLSSELGEEITVIA